jgi:uncharacterized membrane protein
MVRLPDDSAGKNVLCPKCAAVIPVASGLFAPTQAAPAPGPGDNPYSAPQTGYTPPTYGVGGGTISTQIVDAGPVLSYAWKIWSENLLLLVGVTLVVMVLSTGISLASSGIQQALISQRAEPAVIVIAWAIGTAASYAVQIYLGIGQLQLILKLLRRQPASFGDLFAGGPRFWPTVGVFVLAMIALFVGFALCIIPGIILLLMFWPCYYLVVDNKAGVTDSFSVASTITQGNKGTTFVLWLASIGIMLVGLLAFCIGIIFAAPLVSVMWGAAYLMMSGQLSPQPAQPTYGAYGT